MAKYLATFEDADDWGGRRHDTPVLNDSLFDD